jgi:cellulose synthase/poly-beta-1,6-N-acetylglucosamine synthase-like glycosyltransferase
VWIVIALISIALIFYLLGRRWESESLRPDMDFSSLPLVSFIIAAYKSDEKIEKAIKSIHNVNYPKKEIIVVNDSDDRTPEICRRFGAACIQNKERLGKAASLNRAVKEAKGEILFFLDDDTTLSNGSLLKMIPWFSYPETGAVMPRFTVKNRRKSLITRLASFDTNFISNLFKTHMFFGSLISVRGCGFAIRKDVFKKIRGFNKTLTEDIELSARILKSGYRIQYEPDASVYTEEPATITELKKQRIRWGKGAAFSFFRHHKLYIRSPQFLVYFIPYIILSFAVAGFLLFQTSTVLISLLSFYIIYTFSIKQLLLLAALFIIPILSHTLTNITTASIAHMMILTYPERRSRLKEMALLLPYTFFYFPAVMFFYFRGVVSAIKSKRRGKTELDFSDWER